MLPARLNGQLYLENVLHRLNEWIQNLDLPQHVKEGIIFMQDGSPVHYRRQVVDWLNNNFTNRWIGRNGPIRWPARSPDLNPSDFFLWGRIKELVYKIPVENRDDALLKIQQAFQSLSPEEIMKATHGIVRRSMACFNVQGGHFEQIPH